MSADLSLAIFPKQHSAVTTYVIHTLCRILRVVEMIERVQEAVCRLSADTLLFTRGT